MAFAGIPTAANRSIVTASMKSKILNAVLDYADMKISYDESKESRASRIRSEQNHLNELIKVIKATVSSFSKQRNKDFSFNMKTGIQAPKNVEKYLPTYSNVERKREVYLCLNVAEHLNYLLNLFTRQPLLPLLTRTLKENINEKNSRTPSHQGYKIFVWKTTLSQCNKWHRFRKYVFFSNPSRASMFCIPR